MATTIPYLTLLARVCRGRTGAATASGSLWSIGLLGGGESSQYTYTRDTTLRLTKQAAFSFSLRPLRAKSDGQFNRNRPADAVHALISDIIPNSSFQRPFLCCDGTAGDIFYEHHAASRAHSFRSSSRPLVALPTSSTSSSVQNRRDCDWANFFRSHYRIYKCLPPHIHHSLTIVLSFARDTFVQTYTIRNNKHESFRLISSAKFLHCLHTMSCREDEKKQFSECLRKRLFRFSEPNTLSTGPPVVMRRAD
jgi:hypothetical protein